MKRTVLMIAVGIAAVMALSLPASADLFDGMPVMGTMDTYNMILNQYGLSGGGGVMPDLGPWMPPSLIGMPTTTIMDDYYTILPQLQALQAQAHAMGMPYALPGTLGGYDAMNSVALDRADAMSGRADRFANEYILEREPVFTYGGDGYRHGVYADDLGAW